MAEALRPSPHLDDADVPPQPRGARLWHIVAVAATTLALGPWRAVGPQAVGDQVQFRVEVDSLMPGAAAWLSRLIVDGRMMRFGDSSVQMTGLLSQRRWGSGTPSELQLRADTESAVLETRGRSVVLVAEFRGVVGRLVVTRNGKTTQSMDLAPEWRWVAMDDRSPPDSAWPVGLTLLALSVASLATRPWRDGRRGAIWLATILGAWHLSIWLWHPVGTTNDSPEYLEGLHALLRGELSYFSPGYPAFLGALGGGANPVLGATVTLVQHALVVVAAVWTFHLLTRLVPRPLALVGGVLAGGLAEMLTSPQTLMSEAITLFAMVGSVYFVVRAAETGHLHFALLAGACCGWATLTRVVPLLALFPTALAIFLVPRRPASWRGLAGFATTTVLIVGGATAWFGLRSGQFGLSNSGGLHLYNRVVSEQGLIDRDGEATQELVARLGDTELQRRKWWDATGDTGLADLAPAEQVALLRDVALEGARTDPGAFLLHVPVLAGRNLFGDATYWTPAWGETSTVYHRLETPPLLRFGASALRWRWTLERAQRWLWPTLATLALIGLVTAVAGRRDGLLLGLAWLPIGYLLPTGALETHAPRYHVPVTGLLAALAIVGVHRVSRTVRDAAGGSWRPGQWTGQRALRKRLQAVASSAPGGAEP